MHGGAAARRGRLALLQEVGHRMSFRCHVTDSRDACPPSSNLACAHTLPYELHLNHVPGLYAVGQENSSC